MSALPPGTERLLALLGVVVHDEALLLQALTHESFCNEEPDSSSNERLELLGDAVVGLFVAELIYRRCRDAGEGQLTRLKAALVSEAGLARVARDLDLGPLLRVGRGAGGEGIRQRASVLADATEAVFGAVYLDQGPLIARDCVQRLFERRFADVAEQATVDARSRLQHETQRRSKALPEYRLLSVEGPPHDPTFCYEVSFQGQVLGIGQGGSKKTAQQAAATAALKILGGPGADRSVGAVTEVSGTLCLAGEQPAPHPQPGVRRRRRRRPA